MWNFGESGEGHDRLSGRGPTFLRAISFATRKHHGQMRLDGETPYIAHPMRVAMILAHTFEIKDEDTLAAAVLHDTIEDTSTEVNEIRQAFGGRIANFVAVLSKDCRLEKANCQEAYFSELAASASEVKICKMADLLDNLMDTGAISFEMMRRNVDQAQTLLDLLAKDQDFSAWASRAFVVLRKQIAANKALLAKLVSSSY